MDKDISNSKLDDRSGPFVNVPIEVIVSVGKARPPLSELMSMGSGSVLQLDRKVEDPVELFVGDRLVARGVLEESAERADSSLFVRITEVLDTQRER